MHVICALIHDSQKNGIIYIIIIKKTDSGIYLVCLLAAWLWEISNFPNTFLYYL